jgi:hypothetical protein
MLATVYPTSTIRADWTPTPSTPNHHACVDEIATPGDDSDFLHVSGFTGGLISELGFGPIPDDANRITSIVCYCYISGANTGIIPALRFELLLNGVVLSSNSGTFDTSGIFTEVNVLFPNLDISGVAARAGVLSVRITPLNGAGGGYKGFEFMDLGP